MTIKKAIEIVGTILNNKTDQSIFSHRLAEDNWLVLTPIKVDELWTGRE